MSEIPELTEQQWAEYYERLTWYAAKRFFLYGWMGNTTTNERIGPKAMTPADVAAEVITSVLYGNRQYNPEAYRDFFGFLCSAVDSEISNLSRLREHKAKKQLLPVLPKDGDDPAPAELLGREPDPCQVCISEEFAMTMKAKLAPVFAADQIVRNIFECVSAGITSSQEMAELFDVSVQEIENAKKRLRRSVYKIQIDLRQDS